MACNSCELTFFNCTELSEEEIINFLSEHGVIKKEISCGRCGGEVSINPDDFKYRCEKLIKVTKKKSKKCNWYGCAIFGTFLGIAKLPVKQIFRLVSILMHLRPPREYFINDNLGITRSTVVDWFDYSREVLMHAVHKDSECIGGDGITIEFDQAEFGKVSSFVNRDVEYNFMLGGVELNSGKSFLVPVKKRNSETLLNVIKEYVLPGTTIISECWQMYNCLEEEEYVRLMNDHTYNFVLPETNVPPSKNNPVWMEVRGYVPRYGTKETRFAGHLAEYYFKTKYSRKDRIHHFFKAAAAYYRPLY